MYLPKRNRQTMFSYDMAYGGFKDLPRRAASGKLLRDNALNIVKNPVKMMVIKKVLLQWLINCLIRCLEVCLKMLS